MDNIYIEDQEFNGFLELFEEEELKEEHCSICNKELYVRSTIEADNYICTDCAEKAINNYYKQ
jgi:DNA-directed RNA polymerase subunit RPC12/RpoP